jgi:hypothetical protein
MASGTTLWPLGYAGATVGVKPDLLKEAATYKDRDTHRDEL